MALVPALSLPAFVAHTADLKTAVVDAKQLMSALAETSGMKERLEAERERLTRKLKALAEDADSKRDELEKNRLSLSEIEIRRLQRQITRLQNEMQLMQRQFQEELDQREQEELLILRNELDSLVRDFLKKKKYDLVFYSEGLAGFKDGLDITDEMIKNILKQKKRSSKKE